MLASPAGTQGTDWPRWRGPAASGISVDEAVNTASLAPEPKILWKASLGVGYSSPAVSAGLVYCLGNAAGQDTVNCLDAETGRKVWSFSYACAMGSYPGPKATPTVEGGLVYTLSREGHLFALEASTGAVRWTRHLVKDFGIRPPDYDFAGSPVVWGDLLILNAGRSGLALDRSTGPRVWASGAGPGGYATPVLADMGGRPTVVIFGQRAVFGVAAHTGAPRWSFDWETGSDVNAADPVVVGQTVFVASAYRKGSALYDVSGSRPVEIWKSQAFATHFSSFVLEDGFLYGVDGDARTPAAGRLRCMELRTGKVAWSAPLGFGSLIATGSTLVILTGAGTIITADASPLAYTKRGRGSLPRDHYWTPPALSRCKARWQAWPHILRAAPRGWRQSHMDPVPAQPDPTKPTTVPHAACRSAWGRLSAKVYEVDPLLCPRCGSEMKLIALITDPPEVRRILRHLLKIGRASPGLDPSALS